MLSPVPWNVLEVDLVVFLIATVVTYRPGWPRIFRLCARYGLVVSLGVACSQSVVFLTSQSAPRSVSVVSAPPSPVHAAHVVRLSQMNPSEYASQEEYTVWAASACSTTSMTEVLNYYGAGFTISHVLHGEQAVHAISATEGLLDEDGIRRTVERFGYHASIDHAHTLVHVIALANAGTPVIVSIPPGRSSLFPNGHILVVTGGDAQQVFLADSSTANLEVLPRSRFQVLWSGLTAIVTPGTGDSIAGGPSLSASFINQVLARAGSPAAGTGQALYDLSLTYQVDDAYALFTFQHESTYGKYGYGAADHSLGNIVCAGYSTCNGRFRWYTTWEEGYADFYQVIAHEYVAHGCHTLACILPVYAPPSENNTSEYILTARMELARFRSGLLF